VQERLQQFQKRADGIKAVLGKDWLTQLRLRQELEGLAQKLNIDYPSSASLKEEVLNRLLEKRPLSQEEVREFSLKIDAAKEEERKTQETQEGKLRLEALIQKAGNVEDNLGLASLVARMKALLSQDYVASADVDALERALPTERSGLKKLRREGDRQLKEQLIQVRDNLETRLKNLSDKKKILEEGGYVYGVAEINKLEEELLEHKTTIDQLLEKSQNKYLLQVIPQDHEKSPKARIEELLSKTKEACTAADSVLEREFRTEEEEFPLFEEKVPVAAPSLFRSLSDLIWGSEKK